MIQQLNIVVDKERDPVAGYNNVDIDDLSKITNGYVNSMMFTSIDKIDKQNRKQVFIESLKKLCNGGTITIKFLNPITVATKIKNGFIGGDEFADLVGGLKSCWTESDMLSLVSDMREYRINKIYNEDSHIVTVIEKNK